MKFKFVTVMIPFALYCSALSAQFQAVAPQNGPTVTPIVDPVVLDKLLHAERPAPVFHVDDVLSVQVFGIGNYASDRRVAQDGTVDLPFIGTISVAGLTVHQVEVLIAGQLEEKQYVQQPQVSVAAVSQPSSVVTVSGAVAKPGMFPAYGSLTLMDFISQAGGLNDAVLSATAAPASSTVTLIRPGLDSPVSVPLGPNPAASPYARIPLFPGDEVRVGRVGLIYAVGAFKSQGAFGLKTTTATTVAQLVALAGGIGYEADVTDAHILRKVNGVETILPVRVDRILRGRAQDVALQTDDILFVPSNSLRAAIKGGGSGLIVSVATALIYAH
jgi:polysaccharide export outer membrane protein